METPTGVQPDDNLLPRNLPPDVGEFTGRDADVAAILRIGTQQGKRTVVVSGFGGVGKSALAVHAAHKLTGQFPDGQLFADLRGATGREVDAHEVLGRFLQALGVPASAVPVSTDERIEQYRARAAGRRLIIVLDNARGEHQVRPLLPGDRSSLVIVTSRSRLTGLDNAESLELDFLAMDSAIELLSLIIGAERVESQRAEAERIVELCGGLPLAVRAAGAKLLARPHWPLKSLVVRLSDEHRRLDELTVGDLAIRSSLGLNYAELDERQRRAFHLLSVLDLPDFGWWPVAPLLDVSPREAEDIVEHLVDLRLLEVAGVDAIGRVRYRLHDLVQLFGAEQHESGVGMAAAVTRTMATWMMLINECGRDLPRITVSLRPVTLPDITVDPALVREVRADPAEWLKSESAAVVRMVERAYELRINYNTIVSLVSSLATPFSARNEFDEWQRTQEVALEVTSAVGDQQAEAAALAGLGQLHAEKDDFPAALTHFRRAAKLAAVIGDDTTLAAALVGMGTVNRELAVTDAAVIDLGAAAVLGEEIDHLGVVAVANYGLGAISRDKGDIAAATAQFQRCIEVYQKAGDQRGAALSLRGLSLCHRAVGEYAAAADLAAQAVTILDELGDDLGAAYARQSWAKAALRIGKHAEAAKTLAEALETCTRRQDRFGVALITRTLGELHLASGDPAAARQTLSSALDLWAALDLPLWQARTLRDLAAATVTDDPATAEAHWAEARQLIDGTEARESAELATTTPGQWLATVRA
ncbi:tetratricopeptide repeat protein [Kibdelosporangium persicum]|uniref:DNA-binding transcriptional activator of the SARP family n=1 Tax=Kibdelosporangium persicum TaxID=2698649 RepID=A0ABX2FIF4_9PSEU|nr:tetratricopeptide repeat protein [Kibdelosporangium persicum]NRN70561.1 DNA-binding transcriptional activator of the SARP family [Kibdelosporangium persicum]